MFECLSFLSVKNDTLTVYDIIEGSGSSNTPRKEKIHTNLENCIPTLNLNHSSAGAIRTFGFK